jgi:hypothetical protein
MKITPPPSLSCAEVKNKESYTSTAPYALRACTKALLDLTMLILHLSTTCIR